MKSILVVILLLTGCATANKLNGVSLGLSKQEVLQKLGEPDSSSADGNVEVLTYMLREDAGGISHPYEVVFKDGKVIKYGKPERKKPNTKIRLNI